MKKNYSSFFLALSFCCFVSLGAGAQTWKWGTGSINPNTVCESWPIAVDTMGNAYEAGELLNLFAGGSASIYDTSMAIFGSDTVYTNGLSQVLVVSTDSTGAYRWAVSTIGGDQTSMFSLVADPGGNVYVLGFYISDTIYMGGLTLANPSYYAMYFLAKINSEGHVLWLKNIIEGGGNATLTLDPSGNPIISGTYKTPSVTLGTTTLNNSNPAGISTDVFIAKYDTAGNALWAKNLGGKDSSEQVQAITATKSGDIYVSGTFYSDSLTIGSTLLRNPVGSRLPYFFIAKYDSSGNPLWAKQAEAAASSGSTPATESNAIYGMTTDIWDNLYITGVAFDTIIFAADTLTNSYTIGKALFVAYNASGNLKFAKSLTGTSLPIYETSYGVAADFCGNIWVSGGVSNSSTDNDFMFLSEYDTSGTLVNTRIEPAGGDDQNAVAVDNKGGLYVGGDYLYAPFYVGPDTLNLLYSSSEALFVLKLTYPYSFCPDTVAISPEQTPVVLMPGLDLYPNPANNECTVSFKDPLPATTILELYDMTGRLIHTYPLAGIVSTFSTADLSPGTYICRVTTNEAVFTDKLLIMR